MSDDEPRTVAQVLRLVTGPQTSIVGSPSLRCRHHQTLLNTESRTVSCGQCGATVEAFDVLLKYARGEINWRSWDSEVHRRRREIDELKLEERRIKQRTAAASRKDAEAAVAEERRKSEERRRLIAWKSHEVARLGQEIQRLCRLDPELPPSVSRLDDARERKSR